MHPSADVARTLLDEKVIAILRGVRSPRVERVVDALHQGGIRFIEITLEADGGVETLDALRSIVGRDVFLGAGSITTGPQAEAALQAGAAYLVSPGFFKDVSDVANTRNVLYIPGVLTATEVGLALRRGHRVLKLFPAGLMGIEYLRALQAPYPTARFLAVGNIGVNDVARFLGAGAVGVAMGSQLVGRADEPNVIAAKARAIVAQIREFTTA
ncbi:MAG: bifunctional 4-hydroxy-2-oxoglutarate aldolase/2-dehydro-3-deoxy-phosphogluconate aldolase [Armatimonadota bacterium]